MENNNNIEITAAGNDKKVVDALAGELMKYGIMSACFALTWPVAFVGIIIGQKAKKLEKKFLELEGRTYNCAKVGAICGKVGRIAGIVMTVFLAVYIIGIILYLAGIALIMFNQ